MANPLFNAIGGMNAPNNLMGMVQKFKSDPMGMLRTRFNIPENLSNPEAILQHLMNSGQVSQAQYEQARKMAQSIGMR